MANAFPRLLSTRVLPMAALVVPCVIASGHLGPENANIIPNGDFSQGNVGFESELPYTEPTFNSLWPHGYTVASNFNYPLLHKLIAPEPYKAPVQRTGKEKVFFANAGGTEPLVIWATQVKCQPKTQYLITFNCISFSGHIEDGNPPHQIATAEWVPEFEIWADREHGAPFKAGCGTYYKARMTWYSRESKSAIIKIVRTKFPHGGGLIGISNIEMVPLALPTKSTTQ